MAWRYCIHCLGPQDRIGIDDLEKQSFDSDSKITCDHCGKDRIDDSPEERIAILLEAHNELKARIEAIEAQLSRKAP